MSKEYATRIARTQNRPRLKESWRKLMNANRMIELTFSTGDIPFDSLTRVPRGVIRLIVRVKARVHPRSQRGSVVSIVLGLLNYERTTKKMFVSVD